MAVDVCRVLGYKNTRDAVGRLDEDEKDYVGITDAIGRIRETLVVNESGLYSLIFMSHKSEQKKSPQYLAGIFLFTKRKRFCIIWESFKLALNPNTETVFHIQF